MDIAVPEMCCASTKSSAGYATVVSSPAPSHVVELIQSNMAKLDEHVDELEGDIDFFNKSLQHQNGRTDDLQALADNTWNRCESVDNRLTKLESDIQLIKSFINHLSDITGEGIHI